MLCLYPRSSAMSPLLLLAVICLVRHLAAAGASPSALSAVGHKILSPTPLVKIHLSAGPQQKTEEDQKQINPCVLCRVFTRLFEAGKQWGQDYLLVIHF